MTTLLLDDPAVLLSGLGLLGMLAAMRSGSDGAPAESPSHVPDNEQDKAAQPERERLRASHQVRALDPEEEGCATHDLKPGVYGFTHSPAREETPLFGNKTFQSFEVHLLADGSEHIIAFLTAEDLQTFQSGREGAEINLYPEPFQQALHIASVPVAGIIASPRGPARGDGNPLRVTVLA